MNSKVFVFAVVLCSAIFLPSQAASADQTSPEINPGPAAILTAADPSIVQLDTVTVTGTQPGPGMWRVFSGGHELWIMGSLLPLPSNITWNSDSVRSRVVQSQQVIWEPNFSIDAKAGFFKKLYLGYRFYQATKNPDGERLSDVLRPELYARWSRLKRIYLPRDNGVERRRPLLAAGALLKAALRANGLSDHRIVEPAVIELVKERQIKAVQPTVTVKIDDPSAALKDASRISLGDSVCLEATLDVIEHGLPRMVTNANAWSVGDVERIEVASIKRMDRLCSGAFSDAEFARKRGIPDIIESGKARWVSTAEAALKKNSATFSVVPLQDLLGPGGYLEMLMAKGYNVDQP